MSTRILVIFVFIGSFSALTQGQDEIYRTAWGDPDLQGIWGAGYILTPLERPEQFEGREFLTDDEVAAIEGGGNRTGTRSAG